MITADKARELCDNSSVLNETNKQAEMVLEYISSRIESLAERGNGEYAITIYDEAHAMLNPENNGNSIADGNMLRKIVIDTLRQNGFYVENMVDNGKPVLSIRW